MQHNLLNPALYRSLVARFGDVKLERPGQRLVTRMGFDNYGQPRVDILSWGETYRVNCPLCGDVKKKLYISYAYGLRHIESEKRLYPAKCFRCNLGQEQVYSLLSWTSRDQEPEVSVADAGSEEHSPYLDPGECLRLDGDDPRLFHGQRYLRERGLDPTELGAVYGWRYCIAGNPQLWQGGLTNRIIIPVHYQGQEVGWQARLSFEPLPQLRDKDFTNLRWLSMPGTWRSRYVYGYDQAANCNYCVLVEGPTDAARQGPPCVATLGQSRSLRQYEILAETWGAKKAIIIVGDSGEQEKQVTEETADELYARCRCPIYPLTLPHGDPGKWPREEFFNYLAGWVQSHSPHQPQRRGVYQWLLNRDQ
jgi:hypothetical protein